jgi:hypothetical protein
MYTHMRITPDGKRAYVKLYDARLYHEGVKGSPVIEQRIPIGNKTMDELSAEIEAIRIAQRERNAEFRRLTPAKRAGRPRKAAIAAATIPAALQTPAPAPVQQPRPADFIAFDEGTGNTFVLFGASKSGKSTLMMKIYNEYWPQHCEPKRTLTTLFAMSPQIPLYNEGESAKFIIKCPLDPMSGNHNVASYIDWQRKANKVSDNRYTFLNMFDDWIDVRHKDTVNNLIITYRNSNMSAIICLQYTNLLSKAARSNVNNVFLLHMNTDESIEVAIKSYLGALLKKIGVEQSLPSQVQWYRDNTSGHHFIYINPHHGRVYLSKTNVYHQL